MKKFILRCTTDYLVIGNDTFKEKVFLKNPSSGVTEIKVCMTDAEFVEERKSPFLYNFEHILSLTGDIRAYHAVNFDSNNMVECFSLGDGEYSVYSASCLEGSNERSVILFVKKYKNHVTV